MDYLLSSVVIGVQSVEINLQFLRLGVGIPHRSDILSEIEAIINGNTVFICWHVRQYVHM
jgi:hypothetical protein